MAKGHRKRLGERFVNGEEDALSDNALLELLLTFAIPQKDLQPLAVELIEKYVDIYQVLSSPFKSLCKEKGIGTHSATLLKLIDYLVIRSKEQPVEGKEDDSASSQVELIELFEKEKDDSLKNFPDIFATEKQDDTKTAKREKQVTREKVSKTHPGAIKMFNTSLAKETLRFIPKAAEFEDYDEFLQMLCEKLPFNSISTRRRYANYMLSRFFPNKRFEEDVLAITKILKGKEALKDVVFYLILKHETLAQDLAEKVVWPSLATGKVTRNRLIEETLVFYPKMTTVKKIMQAVFDSYVNLGIAKLDNKSLIVNKREGALESLNFILHREIPEPGIYGFEKLTEGPMTRWLLWSEKWIEDQLYHLQRLRILSKVSDIDGMKQFTTKFTPYEAVLHLKDKLGG